MAPVSLNNGRLELLVDPERGGSIMAFRDDGFDLMRPWDGRTESPLAYASFPLVPYSGRIDHGRFGFGGKSYELAPNFAPEPHAIHGDGWTSAWTLTARNVDDLRLELVHDDPQAPLRYRAEQLFTLTPDRLEIWMSVTNLGPVPMPFGLGHHPYFDKRPGTLLSAEVSGVWMPDATNIPRRLEPVPVEWGFRLRRPVEELTLDHIFQGWSGRARIDWPEQDRGVVLEADPVYPNLVVYVPPGRDFFCVEAVSHVGDGFNLMAAGVADTGVRVLEPGEMLAGAMRFVPGPAAAPG